MVSFCFLLPEQAAVHGIRARSVLGPKKLREENHRFFLSVQNQNPTGGEWHCLIDRHNLVERF